MNFENEIKIIGLKDIPLVKKGDNIPTIIIKSLQNSGLSLENGDIIIIAQSLVSKSIGRTKY